MPFKSKAQQRFMFAAEARGELPKGTAREWAHHTKDIKDLPEHVNDKKAMYPPTAVEVLAMKLAAWGNPGLAASVQRVQEKQRADLMSRGAPPVPTNSERLRNPAVTPATRPVMRPMAMASGAR